MILRLFHLIHCCLLLVSKLIPNEFSENAYQLAAKPKEIFWVKDADHVGLYDRVNLVPFAKLTAFLNNISSNLA